MDESGHDHKRLPYEVRGGICVHASEVWKLTRRLRGIEGTCFGTILRNHGVEIKGSKLAEVKRVEWAGYEDMMEEAERHELCRRFLGQAQRNEKPTRREFCAYGQASLMYIDEILSLLDRMQVSIFASFIPRGTNTKPPAGQEAVVRRDIRLLLERFFHFLDEKRETGVLVMDETDRTDDRRFLNKIERYFSVVEKGRMHARRIVPTPLFVGSDMSYPVQAADIMIYLLNQCYRNSTLGIDAPVREDLVELFGPKLRPLIPLCGHVTENTARYHALSVVYVSQPWGWKKEKVSQTSVVFRAPGRRTSSS